jgi:hypothetical protein
MPHFLYTGIFILISLIVKSISGLPLTKSNSCKDLNATEMYAHKISENRELIDRARHFFTFSPEKKQEFKQELLSKNFSIHNIDSNDLNLNNELEDQLSKSKDKSFVESVIYNEINSTHFITKRKDIYKKECFKRKTFLKQQEFIVCVPIQSLMPVLVKTKECINGFFYYEFRFEIITVSYKLVLYSRKTN